MIQAYFSYSFIDSSYSSIYSTGTWVDISSVNDLLSGVHKALFRPVSVIANCTPVTIIVRCMLKIY